jgi:hypothetical protein
MLEALEDRMLLAVQLLSSYNGLDFNSSGYWYPPDTVGAAGPTSYLETVNATVALYTPKATGASSVSDSLFDFFWYTGGLPHAAPASAFSDASMVWDDQVQRFFVADHDAVDKPTGASYFDLAVSKSATPATLTAADWNFYAFATAEAGFTPDYEGNLGYNRDALVWTFDMFGADNHTQINAVNIADLVSGVPAPRYHRADLPASDGIGLRPTVMHDSASGDPMWLIQDFSPNTIRVYKDSSLFDGVGAIIPFDMAVAAHNTPVSPLQPDNTLITTVVLPFILKAAESNNRIVACEQIGVSIIEDDARWYQIDVSSGTPTLADEGNVTAGPHTYILYPGIDINANGQIGMSYMESGLNGPFLSVYVTGRQPDDPVATMETPVLVRAGLKNQHDGGTSTGRLGDFSGISVDTDGTFWIANEFANTELFANWGTVIAHFALIGTPLAPPARQSAFADGSLRHVLFEANAGSGPDHSQAPWFVHIPACAANGLTKDSGADAFRVKSLSNGRFIQIARHPPIKAVDFDVAKASPIVSLI